MNLLATFTDFDGFENFDSFLEGLKVDFAAFGNIEKYAIVTDKKWMQQMAKVESALLPGITMKGFDLGEKEKALAWLK
ncbi:MAG TPA: STAS/SEC14 domain-containing protein [Pricia sp.]|nr:STAS/SEC14 domain-containing protein [Pricia sp.]